MGTFLYLPRGEVGLIHINLPLKFRTLHVSMGEGEGGDLTNLTRGEGVIEVGWAGAGTYVRTLYLPFSLHNRVSNYSLFVFLSMGLFVCSLSDCSRTNKTLIRKIC